LLRLILKDLFQNESMTFSGSATLDHEADTHSNELADAEIPFGGVADELLFEVLRNSTGNESMSDGPPRFHPSP
jgi:hypothetical protein